MTLTPDRIANLQIVTAHIDGPGDASHLYIITGTAVFNWHHTADTYFDAWARETLTFTLSHREGMPLIRRNQVISHAATASLASFTFSEVKPVSNEVWSFAVDSAAAFFSSPDVDIPEYGLNIELALRGRSTTVHRVNFQLTVAAHT